MIVDAPPANFRFSEAGRSRQGRLIIDDGPSQSKESCIDAAVIASEPNPDARMHSTVDKTDYRIQDTHMAIAPKWRSQMFITSVTSSQVKCTTIISIQHLRVPSSQCRSEAENAEVVKPPCTQYWP